VVGIATNPELATFRVLVVSVVPRVMFQAIVADNIRALIRENPV